MANESLAHGLMEDRGAYNRHAKLPIGSAALALPLWEKAVRSARLNAGDEPVVIADYGSSQGKNSLVPMQVAVKVLRERLGADRAISVFHGRQGAPDGLVRHSQVPI